MSLSLIFDKVCVPSGPGLGFPGLCSGGIVQIAQESRSAQSSPSLRNETWPERPITTWSWTATPSAAAARLTSCVISMSAAEEWKVGRFHGAKGGAPRGNRNRLLHGRCSAEAKAERREVREIIRGLHDLLKSEDSY